MSRQIYFQLDGQLYRATRKNFIRLLRDRADDKQGGLFCDYHCDPVESQLITVDHWDPASLRKLADDQERRLNYKPAGAAS